MPETPPPAPDPVPGGPGAADPVHPTVRWERKDADVWWVVVFGAVLVLVAALVHVVLWGMFKHSVNRYEAEALQHPLPPVAQGLPRFPQDIPEIPPPRLQVRDVEDLRALREKEDARLNGPPSWVDRKKGVVRIPIEDAMLLLEERPEVAAAHGARTLPEKGKKP